MTSDESTDGDISEDDIKDKSVDELIKAITDCKGQYAFLIGAGTSKPAGIPTGGELISEWQDEAYQFWNPEQDKDEWIEEKEEEIGEDQNRYGYWFEQVYTTKEQRREYIEDEVVADAEPQFGHIVLASMMAEEVGETYVPLTFTPNFDDLLYDAFYHFIEERPQLVHHNALASEFSLTDDTATIIKVHGDYLYQNVKNLGDETENLEDDIEEIILQAIGEFGLVVIGYSGEDDSIMEPLIDATRSGEGVFWCVREPDELSEYAKELLQQPNTFRVEIEGSEELFSKFFARIDRLQVPRSDDLIERAESRAEALSEKRTEAKKHAPKQDQEEFELSDRLEEAGEYRREGKYDKARETYEEIIENEPDGTDISPLYATAHNDYGHLLEYVCDQAEAARHHYERAININPEYAPVHANLGHILHNEFDLFEEARHHYERAINIDPKSAAAHFNLGLLLQIELDQTEEARHHFERAIDINPDHVAAHTSLGIIFQRELDQADVARHQYERAIEIDPAAVNPHKQLGELLWREFEEVEEAQEHLERALEIDPEYAEAHHVYAQLLEEELDQPEEAEEHYERAAELDPEYADNDEDTDESGEGG